MLRLIGILQGLHCRIALAALGQDQLGERIARAGCRGRAEDGNGDGRQRGVDVLPGLGLVWPLAIRIGRERLIDLLGGELQARTLGRFGKGKAVEADLHFDDLLDAIGLALLELALLDAARGILDVRMLAADAGAEQLHARAGAGRFDDRRLHARVGLGEQADRFLREGIDSRRADRANLVAGGAGTATGLALTTGERQQGCRDEGITHWESPEAMNCGPGSPWTGIIAPM